MAALNFPATPALDDIHTENGTSWKWNGYSWVAQRPTVEGGSGASVTCSATAPESPTQGDVWFNTTTGVSSTYFDGYWIAEGGSVTPNDYITFRNLTILNL